MYALIQKSDNTILRIETSGIKLSEEKPFYWVECPDICTSEWRFDGVNFIPPILPNPPVYIPSVVSMRQTRLALFQSGLLTKVNEAILAGSETDKITWEYATEVNRSDSLVQNLATGLELSETDLDNLFLLASSL